MSDKVISSTTQEFLDVYDIINDIVLLKDGTASLILQVGTMNFSLLAEQEQDAIIFTYGSLLNSLNYPIQINIQSQTKDVTKYLRLLDEQMQKANSDRKAKLIKQYRDFVATLIKERNVLEKHFYVTVPASPGEMGLITATNVLPGKTTFDINSIEKSIILEKAANLLEPRRDHLISQFNRLGLYTKQLNTQEIIQNFYINYNPEAAEGQEISNNENYTTPLVRASFGEKIMSSNITTTPLQQSVINPSIDSVTQEGPIVQEIPVAQEMPVAQEKPVTREAPATQEQPVAQEIPTMQTAPLTSRDSVPLADPANPVNPVAPETPVIPQTTTSFTNEVPVFGGTPSLNSNNSSEFTATATTTMSETDDFSEEIQPLQKPLSTQPNQTST